MNLKTLLLATTLAAAANAQASGGGENFTATHPKWKSECGSCHIPYPARLLPASSWKAMMSGLDRHFGSDASLDAASTAEILAFLEKNASRRKVEASARPQLRITETRWFQSEHDEVPTRLWKDPRVKNSANCAACHTGAENGDFNEHNIRMPR